MIDADEMVAFSNVIALHGFRDEDFEVREAPEPAEGGGAPGAGVTVVVTAKRTGVTLRYPPEPHSGWVERFRADLMHGAYAAIL